MPPKKAPTKKVSLNDFNQQVQEQQRQQLLEQQKQRQQQQAAAAAQKKPTPGAPAAAKSSNNKKVVDTKKKGKEESKPRESKAKSNYKQTEDDKKVLEIVREIVGEDNFEQIDEPVLNYIACVLNGQNNVNTRVAEKEVVELVSMFLLQTIGASLPATAGSAAGSTAQQQQHESARQVTGKIIESLREKGHLKVLAEEEHKIKVLEEAVNLGKHFEDQLKQQQKMIKNLTSSGATVQEEKDEQLAGVNYNEKLDWEEKAVKARQEKRKKKANKEKEAQSKEYSEYLKSRGIASGKSVVKIHHSETIGGSRDIVCEEVTIAVGQKDLLARANLTLLTGKRYGLIGRNGIGKTTLLRHIVEGEIEGIPPYLQILHIEQEIQGDDTTALDAVLKTDVERERLLAEEQQLLASNDEKTSERLSEVYTRMEEIDAHSAESRAANILSGLQFSAEMQRMKTKHFSGGWRMRIALARALFVEPDVLLLDEPTNHLDLHAVLWLENYLNKWKKTLVVVSHSRSFLNAVATDIVHFQDHLLKYFRGNYDIFEKTRIELLKQQATTYEAQQKQKKHIQSFIDRFRYKAATAKLVQSRIKAMQKMEFVAAVVEDPSFQFTIPSPEHVPPPFIQAVDVTFGYSAEKVLFRDLNFNLDHDSRIALVGANGSGKSTFLNVLMGELKPLTGVVNLNKKIRIARFSQHHMEQLALTQTPLEYMRNKFPQEEEQTLRAHLGGMGVTGSMALQPIYTLSGGQKSRVVFAEITFKKPHLLMLDEPTNHLDLDTVDALIQALNEYVGGLMLISHDEHLINMVCDEIWICGDGRINKFDGSFEDYKKTLQIKF